MTNRERALAILRYEKVDRLPAVHFGYWIETLEKWANEGHITKEEATSWDDGNAADESISKKAGFDFGWYTCYHPITTLLPPFERKVLEVMPDGSRKVLNKGGAIEIEKDEAGSIPAEVGHTLVDRASWEEHYLPKLQLSTDRVDREFLATLTSTEGRENPKGLFCGSLFGEIRNWLGVENSSYLLADDEELYDEIINTVADLAYDNVKQALETGAKFDYAHYWEDICFKNGPLVIPSVFDEKVGPHYKKISDLLNSHGIDIISLDCDGVIDSLIPTWLNNGVNTMFPIEVGVWDANIAPWREKYGKEILGVGGMMKHVFSLDYAAIDAEIERLKPLIALGGFIPCPDHRIAPDAKWENVQYYCEQLRKVTI